MPRLLPHAPRAAVLLAAVLAGSALAPSAAADAGGGRVGDRLTVTVRHLGGAGGGGWWDGTFELNCHPAAGSHPDADAACSRLDRITQWGRDTFAPVPDDSICTMQYGGPATAHVTGTWAGRPVDASFDRTDGCHIGQWDRLVPLLPDLSPRSRGRS
ncbi:SSI family serine proteinase inhibitor [Streptomyces sp. NPDC005840]|jgi:hypothetical protein|uniref:SSI family serine proteinase inhibitor n=1 Tax=unclassified Streptomyces TaxID=2593676 RepID=UPI00331687F6